MHVQHAAHHTARPTVADWYATIHEPAMFPTAYTWFVVLSAFDLLLTSLILHLGGREVNVIANAVLMQWDLLGLTIYKFSLVLLVIVLCEMIGRLKEHLGRMVSGLAVAITAFPVVAATVQLVLYYFH
ncbi:MAG: hypothetical protein JJU36_03040 [Phycisphaeraceae bacterium]|nr:hypothetical protein [Phycisphaeraceae bacterium]